MSAAESQVVTVDLVGCARCHGDGHPGLQFKPLTHPVEHHDDVIGTHFALCPTNGEPILMRTEPRVFACRR